MKFAHLFFVGAACATLSSIVHADLPLNVEDLITEKGKLKLDLSLSYANSDQQGVSTAEPVTVQTGATSFITLPTLTGERKGNTDVLVNTVGLRYGLTAKAEVYGRASYLYRSTRSNDLSGTSSSSDSNFADAWAGINYQFKEDDDTPALLGFAEVALHEKNHESNSSFKSWMLGLTAYKAIDPVVISLTTGYRFSQSRKDGDVNYKPGNLMLLSPSVGFAVNERVTLTTGLQWTNTQASTYDGQAQSFRRTSTNLLLGAGYGVSKDSILNTTLSLNASGQSGADLRFNWLYTF